MPDRLTEEERAAIAAFPREKVYICRRGESGIPIYPMSSSFVRPGSAKKGSQFARSRMIDDQIRSFSEQGLTDAEISEKVKLTPGAVYRRRYRMGMVKGLNE